MKYKFSFIFLKALFAAEILFAQQFIAEKEQRGYFPIIDDSSSVSIYTDINDYTLIQKSAQLLKADIQKVTGRNVFIVHEISASEKNIIIIGTDERSSLISQLVQKKILS